SRGRCFSITYYDITTKAGVKLMCTWLCYSPKLDSAYCEPCWLFADCSAPAYNVAWVRGVRDWCHLSSKIEYHETSKIHLDSCLVYEQWRLHGTIDEDFETQIQKEKNFWRQVLECLINVTFTLSMCNLAFRGHREVLGHANSGNFLSIVELLAMYDPMLKQVISMPSGSILYLSHNIQDELIEILSKHIEGNIVEEIKAAPFFSIIVDTTQDILKTDQLNQIFQYVTIETDERNVAIGVKINESFLGFQEICDQSSSGLEKKIISCIEQKGLDISKCRGQGYDGASNMSGMYSGVQARISKKEPNAEYVHCAAHNFNLTMNDSVRGIPEVKYFYDVIETLYTFFGHSIKCWTMLSSFASTSELSSNLTLKRLCPTRWSSQYESLLALRFRYLDIMKALTKIVLLSKNADEHCEASALKKLMENLNFVFLVLQTKILEVVNAVSKLLQSKDTDLYKAAKLLCKVTEDLAMFQNNFKEAKSSAIKLLEKWGGQTKFEEKRVRKVKRHFDELCEDERLANSESFFKVNVFYRCLNKLTNHFQSLQAVADKFSVIQPNMLISASDEDLYKEAEKLANHFNKDISLVFPGQLLSFSFCLKSEISKQSLVKDLANMLIVDNALASSFSDVCTVLLLFLTIPVTVASAERSFSKLKLIKNYPRSTTGQERLCGLGMLSIENDWIGMVDVYKITSDIADTNACKMFFF
uniref:DUF4371 domain-containing protein n=1 Tax=Latimeria chalumnae TaxID=7897 RepID=H3A162_LATCH